MNIAPNGVLRATTRWWLRDTQRSGQGWQRRLVSGGNGRRVEIFPPAGVDRSIAERATGCPLSDGTDFVRPGENHSGSVSLKPNSAVGAMRLQLERCSHLASRHTCRLNVIGSVRIVFVYPSVDRPPGYRIGIGPLLVSKLLAVRPQGRRSGPLGSTQLP